MKKNFLSILIAVLMLVAIPGIAQSAIVTFTFIATVSEGPLTGEFGTGSFTFDDDLIKTGDEDLTIADGLEVSFVFDGQNFDQNNDVDFPDYPLLVFENNEISALDFVLTEGENGVDFDNPLLFEIGILELFPDGGSFDFETELFTTLVPIPGAFWLFGSALAGLALFRKRMRNKA